MGEGLGEGVGVCREIWGSGRGGFEEFCHA